MKKDKSTFSEKIFLKVNFRSLKYPRRAVYMFHRHISKRKGGYHGR